MQAPIIARLAARNGADMAAAAISFGRGFLLLTAAPLTRGAVPGLGACVVLANVLLSRS